MSRFKKGQSGNPSGRPPGTKSAPSLIRDLLRDGVVTEHDLRAVVAAVLTKAKDGDLAAAALLLDRTIPKLRAAADPDEEGAVAAARAQGVMSVGPTGISLEQLVSGSFLAVVSRPAELPAASPPAAAILPSTPAAAAPPPEPPRPIRITMPPAPDDGIDEPYRPF